MPWLFLLLLKRVEEYLTSLNSDANNSSDFIQNMKLFTIWVVLHSQRVKEEHFPPSYPEGS